MENYLKAHEILFLCLFGVSMIFLCSFFLISIIFNSEHLFSGSIKKSGYNEKSIILRGREYKDDESKYFHEN
jgi:hypothetical protein